MSQKSSLPQPAKSVSQVLMSDTVRFSQNVQHEMRLPASDRHLAIQHADWLIADAGPLEFDMIDERVEGLYAEAVS